MWALANMGVDPGDQMMTTLADAAYRRITEFSPQNVSNTAWYAKLKVVRSRLLVGNMHASQFNKL